MYQIDHALVQLIESKTDAEEQRAAERLVGLVREQRLPLNLTVYDATTSHLIPLNSLGDNPTRSVYVELSAGSEVSIKQRRWVPRQIQNMYILMQE